MDMSDVVGLLLGFRKPTSGRGRDLPYPSYLESHYQILASIDWLSKQEDIPREALAGLLRTAMTSDDSEIVTSALDALHKLASAEIVQVVCGAFVNHGDDAVAEDVLCLLDPDVNGWILQKVKESHGSPRARKEAARVLCCGSGGQKLRPEG